MEKVLNHACRFMVRRCEGGLLERQRRCGEFSVSCETSKSKSQNENSTQVAKDVQCCHKAVITLGVI